MSKEPNNLKAALRVLADEARQGAHATSEELMAYHGGDLSVEQEKPIQDHLVACRGCTSLLLDLAAFPHLDQQGARPLSASEIATAGQTVREQIRRRTESEGLRAEPLWLSALGSRLSALSSPYAVAASLLIVSLALGGWILSLRRENQRLSAHLREQSVEQEQALIAARKSLDDAQRQLQETARRAEQTETQMAGLRQTVAELSQPQINAPIADLFPRDFTRAQEGAVKTIDVPSGASVFTLILNVSGQPSHSGYALEILDQRGQRLWQGGGLHKSQFNNFTVTLSRRSFPAGQYRINLYGLRGGGRELVEGYALRIRYHQ